MKKFYSFIIITKIIVTLQSEASHPTYIFLCKPCKKDTSLLTQHSEHDTIYNADIECHNARQYSGVLQKALKKRYMALI